MKYPKRGQYKYAKSPFRIRNWPEYEAGLRRRGEIPFRAVASEQSAYPPAHRQYGSQDSRRQSGEATEEQGLAEAAPCS